MRIGIIGTRGIPNHYGGFEQFAEYLSRDLVQRGHEVVVYNSSDHPYQETSWEGVRIEHCTDWENKIGTAGQFIYDFNCIVNSRKQNFDILLQLGYTSSSIWKNLLPKNAIVVTNMDGLEWKRSKFSKTVQGFLKRAERWAVNSSTHLVADSKGIQSYLKKKYGVGATYIAYGSHLFNDPNPAVLDEYNLIPDQYNMLIARLEPENNIEMILDGVQASQTTFPFLVIGKTENPFSSYLIEKYANDKRIRFLGGIYNLDVLNNLRYHCNCYFHGHSVGGTNPSLLEAMASSAFIAAHHNEFNQSVLESEALYFSNKDEVTKILDDPRNSLKREQFIESNREKIKVLFSWEKIIGDYEDLFLKLAAEKQH